MINVSSTEIPSLQRFSFKIYIAFLSTLKYSWFCTGLISPFVDHCKHILFLPWNWNKKLSFQFISLLLSALYYFFKIPHVHIFLHTIYSWWIGFIPLRIISVSSSCYNKLPQTFGLKNTKLFPYSSGGKTVSLV